MKKLCVICGQEFDARDKRSVCCKDPACRKQFNHIKYITNVVECVCKECGKSYFATIKQSHDCCPDCTSLTTRFYKTQITQKHICRQCNKVIFTEIKNATNHVHEFVYDVTCDDCKKKNIEAHSIRMKLDNPSYKEGEIYDSVEDADTAKKQKHDSKLKYRNKDDMYLAFSERMKLYNPMFNEEIKQKVHTTIQNRIKLGEITYDRTKNKNYKGDRGIKNYIRLSLAWWRKENFERTNYTCECCGATNVYLNVHHTEKFSNIVERFANELNLDLKTVEYGSEKYNELEKLVNDYHKEHDIGLVVCENCHDNVDVCFHKRKSLEVDNNERNTNKKY